jgi:hypothetical protein
VYSTPNGNYIIECGIDRANHDLGSVSASSFSDCINQCASTAGCVDVSYIPGGVCYLKNGQGYPNSNSGVWGAAQYPYVGDAPPSTTAEAPTTTAAAPTTSAAAPTTSTVAPSGPSPSCPADDKTYYYTGGIAFYIECYTDRSVWVSLP